MKSPTVVIGATDPIRMPRGRQNIDFECAFDVVIGKTAKYVPIANAADYIFGYTVQIDVSDRGGRGDRKMGGSDWLVGITTPSARSVPSSCRRSSSRTR